MGKLLPEIGRLAVSKAGRDAGRTFVIVAMPDAEYVLLADGALRTIEKPKRKKLRHVRLCIPVAEDIRNSLSQGRQPLNSDLRKAVARY